MIPLTFAREVVVDSNVSTRTRPHIIHLTRVLGPPHVVSWVVKITPRLVQLVHHNTPSPASRRSVARCSVARHLVWHTSWHCATGALRSFHQFCAFCEWSWVIVLVIICIILYLFNIVFTIRDDGLYRTTKFKDVNWRYYSMSLTTLPNMVLTSEFASQFSDR